MLANFNARNFKEWLVFSLETPDTYAFNKEAVYNGVIKDAVIVGVAFRAIQTVIVSNVHGVCVPGWTVGIALLQII